MKKNAEPTITSTPAYWKARLLADAGKGYWAYTQSISLTELHFQCEKLLKPKQEVSLTVQAMDRGVKHPMKISGQVLSCVLLSCGTLYGIDLQITNLGPEDRQFISRYIADRNITRLSYNNY